jgi:hypothetical protein
MRLVSTLIISFLPFYFSGGTGFELLGLMLARHVMLLAMQYWGTEALEGT